MKKLIYLFILGIGFTSCSVESMDSTEDLIVADASSYEITDPSTLVPISEWTFNNGNKDQGKVTISNDCQSVTISFSSYGDDLDVEFNIFNSLPSLNNGGQFASSVVTFDETDLDENNSYKINFSQLNNVSFSETLIVYAKAFGKDAGTGINGKNYYFTYEVQEVTCSAPVCESGYMYGETEFTELDETAENWGWGQEFNLEAGQTVISNIQHKNDVLGYVEITLNLDGSVTISAGPGVNITHRYVSDERPTDTAPGQFDKIGNKGDENRDGAFWVMIKADVCE